MKDNPQSQEQVPQWNHNWNHMALPTFGFIFAVPGPPQNLQLPAPASSSTEPTKQEPSVAVEQKLTPEDGTATSGSSHHLVSRLHSRRLRKTESDKRLKQRSQPYAGPTLALQEGNSDPFSAAAITITPHVNQILTFARDVCLPAFYFVESLRDPSTSAEINRDIARSSGWISSPAAQLGWQQVIDALANKCTALACLSTYLALMAASNISKAKAREASLKMRANSSALLRQNLIKHETSKLDIAAQQELLWQVFWHFYAEFFSGNMIAAQIHGKMLKQSCENAVEGVITDHFLDSVMYVDSHMTAKYLLRPILDVDSWLPDVFASIWEPIDTHIFALTGENGEQLHASVTQPVLREVFIRTRQSILVLDRIEDARDQGIDSAKIYYWLNSYTYVNSGKLIDRYLKLVEIITETPDLESISPDRRLESLGTLHTESALCLATVYAIRDLGQEVRVNGVDVVDASATIMKHLKEAIEQALSHCTIQEKSKYQAAHLWCAYLGALSEQRLALARDRDAPPSKPRERIGGMGSLPFASNLMSKQTGLPTQSALMDPSSMHFNHLLAQLASSMGLVSWHQVYELLRQFIFSDHSEPHGSRWFWKTMGAFLDRRSQAARFAQERRRVGQVEAPSSIGHTRPQSIPGRASPDTSFYNMGPRGGTPVGGSDQSTTLSQRHKWDGERQDRRSWSMSRTNSYGSGMAVQRAPQRRPSERHGLGETSG